MMPEVRSRARSLALGASTPWKQIRLLQDRCGDLQLAAAVRAVLRDQIEHAVHPGQVRIFN
jgi:hypothetical protein